MNPCPEWGKRASHAPGMPVGQRERVRRRDDDVLAAGRHQRRRARSRPGAARTRRAPIPPSPATARARRRRAAQRAPRPRRRRRPRRSSAPGRGGRGSEIMPARLLARRPGEVAELLADLRRREGRGGPPALVDSRTSLPTRSGSASASASATKPPIDQPSTSGRSSPSSPITPAASAARSSISNGAPSPSEPPIPRWSTRITSRPASSAARNPGSQSALVAAYPLRTSSGAPAPRRS